jgi:hypothetical protein
MKAKASLVVVVILFVSLISAGWISRGQPVSTTRWEYKVTTASAPVDDWLNKQGADGWELVQITGADDVTGSKVVTYYFKRPK